MDHPPTEGPQAHTESPQILAGWVELHLTGNSLAWKSAHLWESVDYNIETFFFFLFSTAVSKLSGKSIC